VRRDTVPVQLGERDLPRIQQGDEMSGGQIKHGDKDWQEVRDQLHTMLDHWGVTL
jgi:hypothetical protein